MSAAATAAGYLYASGRLRGRAAREHEQPENSPEKRENRSERRENRPDKPQPREKVRVAVYEPEFESPAESQPKPAAPRRAPKIEYRTRRRWTPE